jgi:hypothetical protein
MWPIKGISLNAKLNMLFMSGSAAGDEIHRNVSSGGEGEPT